MRYKKYIFILLLIMVLGCNRVYAKTTEDCFYSNEAIDFNARLTVTTNVGHFITSQATYTKVIIDRYGNNPEHDDEDVNNWYNGNGLFGKNKTKSGYQFQPRYKDNDDADANGTCPVYLVFQKCGDYQIFATDSETEAKNAVASINSKDGCTGYYSSKYKSDGKTERTAEEYWSTMIRITNPGEAFCEDKNNDGVCDDLEKGCQGLFGDVKDAGSKDANGKTIKAPSLAYMIHQVLLYVRIIVPILIILLGSLDLAKAVTAGKEDEMRKAQMTLVKRVVAGVAIFFVPVLVDLIMRLADMVWEGLGHCNMNL